MSDRLLHAEGNETLEQTAKRRRIPITRTQPVWDEEMKRVAFARPSRYRPDFAHDIMETMAEGYSLGAFAGRVGVSRKTINDWIEKYPEFDLACARGKAIQQFYWETRYIQADLDGTPIEAAYRALLNCAREDWRQKQELEISGQVTFASIIDHAMKTIEARRAGEAPTEQIETTYQELAAPQDDLF